MLDCTTSGGNAFLLHIMIFSRWNSSGISLPVVMYWLMKALTSLFVMGGGGWNLQFNT
jgi:hypothetical protein